MRHDTAHRLLVGLLQEQLIGVRHRAGVKGTSGHHFGVSLFRAVHSVAGIAETGHDVAVLVETFIDSRREDPDV